MRGRRPKLSPTNCRIRLEFLQRENALYLATLDDLLATLVAQDNGFNNILMVAHNPGLTTFANYLAPGISNNLPTAGIVSVQIDRDDWNLFEQAETELIVYDYPKRTA